jgi:serine/threonine protein kinase
MVTCPECGAELSRSSPRGICTRCLFMLGLEPDAASAPSEPAGSNLFETPRFCGDYELLEEIARGGMGIVFRARQTSLARIVAIKMILAGQFATQEQALRFRAEAEAAARLRHPNIVAIFETGEADRQPFIAMEYVPGGNLSSLVRDGPVPPKQAAALVKTIAEAIDYAHQQGLLHRDLKPSNILLDETGQPRITDFGLARRVEKESFLTITGQVLGSPNFMPPEQAGAKSTKAGRYSDVYALGGILFYLTTGRPPFLSESVAQTLQLVLHTEPVSPRLLNPAVPLDLATICLKCLEKDAAKR